MTTIDLVKSKLPDEDTVIELSEFFKIFGDSTRTKILSALEIHDLNVGELAEAIQISVSAVSHQLRILRSAKLVKATKQGKEVIYSLDDEHVLKIVEYGLSHINEK